MKPPSRVHSPKAYNPVLPAHKTHQPTIPTLLVAAHIFELIVQDSTFSSSSVRREQHYTTTELERVRAKSAKSAQSEFMPFELISLAKLECFLR